MATTASTQQSNGNMPSAKVSLSTSTPGIFHIPQVTPEAAKKASDLLSENHIKNHIFFNNSGFHNHIVHHLLTLYALGATPSQIQVGFTNNQSYQRPLMPLETSIIEQMRSSREKFASFFGSEKYYRAYQDFYEGEIANKGVKGTLKEWVFKGDEAAEGVLTRLFAGFFHPIIHMGFGLEFHQPAILAESLAQASIHDNWVAPYLHGCEKSASPSQPSKPLLTLLAEAKANDTIRNSPHVDDGNKTRDGVIGRAAEPMIKIASQWTVQPTVDDLRFKTAEMIQTAFYFTAAAQNPRKIPKFDFFYMHCTNSSIFFSSFLEDSRNAEIFGDDEDGRKNLVRLLEMKARTDLAMYISRNSPDLDVERIKNYEPKRPQDGWNEIFARVCAYEDDGHSSKFIRATANAERACGPFEEKHGWPIRGAMWLKIGHMIIDSVEAGGPTWIRGAGWEKEWNDVPDRVDAKL